MSKYALKIKTEGSGTKVISILRKFDPSLSIAEIRKRMQEDDFVVKYDKIQIYSGEEPVSKAFFENSMQMLREIADEVDEDMDREAEL